LHGPQADQYDTIGEKRSDRLAQQPGSDVVLEYIRPIIKHKASEELISPPRPSAVFPGCMADVSVLAGMLVDKFAYHLPLYRQHQRLADAGITLSRSTLTHWVKRSIALLEPIVAAQLQHILHSQVLAVDETPIKAGKQGKGKRHQGWFLPVFGEDEEIVFTSSPMRAAQHLEAVHSLPVVDRCFAWCHAQRQRLDLTPSHPLSKALAYATKREAQLRVFLSDPEVPPDTNHRERARRVIPMGRRNWLFCWSEVGAKQVGVIQSLLTTCRMQGVDPYVYRVDVLQRVSLHPNRDCIALTPRLWQERFAKAPLHSGLAS
jgi:transposase